MSEIRNLTRNGETFYPLTHVDGVIGRNGVPLGEVNGIFDVSEYNASGDPLINAQYDTLALALEAVPQDRRKGGMTIRYIDSVSEEYVQYRYLSTSTSSTDFVDTSNWQGIDEEPIAGSSNLVESGGALKVLEWIYKDRNLLSQIQRYIEISTNVAYVGGRTEGFINNDGQISTPSAYKYTTLIPIKPATSYIGAGASALYAALYDINGVFTRRINAKTAFTTAINEVYLRLCSNTASWSTVRVNEGTTVLEYERFYVHLKKDALDPEFLADLNGEMYEVCSRLYEYSHGNYKSGYVNISGTESAGTARRRSGYLPYNGGDVIVYGASSDSSFPLAVFFSGQSSDNCLGYFPNPRNSAYNNTLTLIKESDIPSGTTYIRFNGNTNAAYFNSLDENSVTVDTVNAALQAEVARSTAVDTQINTDLAKIIEKSTNLANKEGYVAPRTFDDNGEIVSTNVARYACENYIDVKPFTTYTMYRVQEFIEYDENKVFVKRNKEYNGAYMTVTTQSNTRYIRFGGTQLYSSQAQINEGSELLEYEPYYDWKIPDVSANKIVDAISGGGPYEHGPFDIKMADFCAWYEGLQEEYATSSVFGRDTTYAEVIAAFDALAALDTQYITKNTLGTASGTDANDQPYTIYEYVFKPKRYPITLNKKKVPKIMMDGSIHGFEKNSTYGLYYFLKDLAENWDKSRVLTALRSHVEIHVIPVTNPYGFDNNTYKNANSVNINRNFDHPGDWVVVPSGDDQNGLEAFDQPESAIIRDWINNNYDNILCYMNLHTNGQYNASGYGEMNACMTSSDRNDPYYNRIFNVFARHIEEQTLMWPKLYNAITPSSAAFCGKNQSNATSDSTKGTASAWANTMNNLLAMTLEGFNGLVVNDAQVIGLFSANSKKINSENIGNMVIQMICEFGEE